MKQKLWFFLLIIFLIPTSCTPKYPDELEVWVDESQQLDTFQASDSINVYFSEPMDPESVETPLKIIPAVRGEITWNEDHTTLTFKPNNKFRPGSKYSVVLQEGLASESGKTFEHIQSWRYSVDYGYSGYHPEPRSGKIDLDNPVISIDFGIEEVDQDSLEEVLSVMPSYLETHTSWEENTLHIQIDLDSGLLPDSEVIVEIEEGAKTVGLRDIRSRSFEFSTEPLKATVDVPEEFSRSAPIEISFNYPMDPDSLEDGIKITPPFEFTPKWEAGNRTLILETTQPFQFGKLITVLLDSPLQTANAYELEAPIVLTYQTPSLIASIESKQLTDGNTEFQFMFSVDVDNASVESALSIFPKVPYHTEWKVGPRFRAISEGQLPADTEFRITLAGEIVDADGLATPVNATYLYKTEPPVVVSGEPRYVYGLENVFDPYSPLELAFDRPIDQDSFLDVFSIDPEAPLEIEWISKTKVKLIPQPIYLEQTEYRLSIEPTLLDTNGSPVLTKTYSFDLYMDDYADALSFGMSGANVQVLDLDASRLIEVGRPQWDFQERQVVDTIRVELVRLTMADMIDFLQFSTGRSWRGGSPLIYDTSGFGVQAAWEVTMEDIENAFGEDAGPSGIQLPENISEGLYIMNLITDHVNDQIAVVATRASIMVKVGKYSNGNGQVLAWVNNINSYMMKDTDVWVFDEEGTVIASGQTNDIGLFESAFSPDKFPYVVMARRDDTFTISGVGDDWETRYTDWWDDFWSDFFETPLDFKYLVYTYTDRPIYQPGQEVFYKGVVRYDNDAHYTLPSYGKEVEVTLKDSRGNKLSTKTATLNTFGTFNGSFQLAEGGMLGEYSIKVAVDGETHEQAFKVQAYKKPDITVNVTTDKAVYVNNDDVKVKVNTAYLFGEPVANADVTLNVFELAPNSYHEWWVYADEEDELPVEAMSWFETSFSKVSATTDENGIAEFTIQAPIGKLNSYYYYYDSDSSIKQYSSIMGIEATVDDGSDQYVSGFSTIKVYSTSAQIRLDLSHWVYETGNPVTINVGYASEFEENLEGKQLELVVEKRTSEYYWSYEAYETLTLETDSSGRARIELDLEDSGLYRLKLSGEDTRGNTLRQVRYFYLKGEEDDSWWVNYNQDLTVSTDEEKLRPGEIAQIMVESNFSGEGLLTIERGGVYETRVVQLTAPVTVLEVPIKSTYAPNVYITVQIWEPIDRLDVASSEYWYYSLSTTESKLRMDTVEIEVEDIKHELTLCFSSDKTTYLPREEATFTVEVKDYLGQPVVAEVSLGLVDEAIYLLSEELSLPIHDSFYQPREWGVLTSDSMSPYRRIYPLDAGGGGGDGAFGDGGNPRSDFPDTVVWYPTITTNEAGRAQITITLPDTLTTWRLTGKAVTKDTLVGEGNYKVITHQPVVVRPLLPGVVTEGDEFLLSAVVHNFSEVDGFFRVSIKSGNLEISSGKNQMIGLGAGESKVVVWQAQAIQPGEAEVTVTASSDEYSDAVQMSFLVVPLQITSHSVESGRFSGQVEVQVTIPVDSLPESHIVVQVNRAIGDSMLDGVEYLTGFPYGCVEQLMSKALPNAVVARAFNQLGLGDQIEAFNLDEKIASGIQRLYGYQHSDGGWGWWFDDPSDAYQTAWVLYGLAVTREAGYDISEDVLADGAAYLNENLAYMNMPTQAYALYAMSIAGYGNLDETLPLTSYFQDLDAFSQAALVLTLYDLGEVDQAKSLMDIILLDLETTSDGNVYIPGEDYDGYYHKKFMSSEVRSNAVVLKALLEIDPENDYVHDLANWLMSKRSHHGWGTTNETAFSLLALSDYILIEKLGEGSETVALSINGESIGEVALDKNNPAAEFAILVGDIDSKEAVLVLSSDSSSLIYYLVDAEIITKILPDEGQGVEISRSYYPISGDVPKTEFDEGVLVEVRIEVNIPEDSFYIIIEDPLPGGFVALNENLNITSHDSAFRNQSYYKSSDFFRWQEYGYNNKEVYPDKVVFFVTEVRKGTYEISYLARATVAGEFTAMPVVISAMYRPDFYGRSTANEVTILPR